MRRIDLKSTVSLALLGIIVWYWEPHFMVSDILEAEAPPIAVTLPPLEEPTDSQEMPEPPEPETPEVVAEEQPEAPQEVTQEVANNTPAPATSDNKPEVEQPTSEQVATTPAVTGQATIVGRTSNVMALVTWLRHQGGSVWFDDGHFSAGKIYELGADNRIAKVSVQRFEQAIALFAPRSMSKAERNRLLSSLNVTAPATAQRLILLWPKSVWADVQARVGDLGVNHAQLEYRVNNNRLSLRIVSAQRNGVNALELSGKVIFI